MTIYLDYAATTPLDPRVLQAMLPALQSDGLYANAASSHAPGFRARAAVERARAQVAALIGAEPSEIVWTSGATESNNLAIKGALEFRGLANAHIVTSRIEHRCVLDTCRYLETRGVRVTYLKPDAQGRIAPEAVLAALTPETALVSLMWVNNEIGNVLDVAQLAPLLRQRGVLFHVDAAQAAGRVAIDLRELPVDLLSLSAHKAYGPKGAGALFVRRRPRARLAPQLHGGGHEQGMRSGTLATHQIVGMGAAFELLAREGAAENRRIAALRERLWQGLQALDRIERNGDPERSAPQLLNVSFAGVEGEALRASLPELAVSSGSACSSATQEPSYVLRALGRSDDLANASLRFSPGRWTTEAQVDTAAARVVSQVRRLRAIAEGGAAGASLPADEDVFGYGVAIWSRFREARRAGRLDGGPVLRGEAGTPAGSHRLVLEFGLDPRRQRVTTARFRAYGCPSSIAVGDWIAERAQGSSLAELAGVNAAVLRQALEIPESRLHCALMGEDALHDLLACHNRMSTT